MPRISRRIAPLPVCSKRGCSPTYRAHEGRPELQAARGMRWRGTPAGDAAQRRPDERLQGRGPDAGCLPPAKPLLGDRGYDAGWFRNALAERGIARAFHQKPTAKYRSTTTACSTASATRSRTCSASSKTGDASTPATTDALTPSSPPSASLQPSSSGSINKS